MQEEEELPKLRLLIDKIEDFYIATQFESRYCILAQKILPRLYSYSPSNFISLPYSLSLVSFFIDNNFMNKKLTNLIFAQDKTEEDDQIEIKLTRQIMELYESIKQKGLLSDEQLNKLESIQTVRIADFFACYRWLNPILLQRLATFYGRYYGSFNPRLLFKLYHFIGILLVKVSQIYLERSSLLLKDNSFSSNNNNHNGSSIQQSTIRHKIENTQLESCFRVISHLVRKSKVIQQFLDQRIQLSNNYNICSHS